MLVASQLFLELILIALHLICDVGLTLAYEVLNCLLQLLDFDTPLEEVLILHLGK